MNQSKAYNEGYDFYFFSDQERINPYPEDSEEAVEWLEGLKAAEQWDKGRAQ
jgi:hypothetical protein